ncbi:metallophosphoesterase [Haloplanus sp. C73]|uniref:metallophosphoesterase n=1 Tax=Haloplanus sp. C73 TaxID=3421641 RepID=UPI003EB9C23F
MTTWQAIRDRSFLDRIEVTVVDATHHDGERLDWQLTVADSTGKEFDLDIWQKHDPLTEWEAGAAYEIRGGYGQVWDDGRKKKLHSSGKWSADRLDASHECRVMVMGDSHVGRADHPSKAYRAIDCAGRFREAVETAVTADADCIVHTGDVFHDSVTESDCEMIEAAFERLSEAGIGFHYILGNHECDRGRRLLRRWERLGVATHLDTDGTAVADGVTVYGYDYRPGSSFDVDEVTVPATTPNSVSILALHQTLAPFRANADVDLNEIAGRAGGFEYVVSGHLHDPERPDWANGEFLYAGATEDISTNPSPAAPSVWSLTVDGTDIETRRHKL